MSNIFWSKEKKTSFAKVVKMRNQSEKVQEFIDGYALLLNDKQNEELFEKLSLLAGYFPETEGRALLLDPQKTALTRSLSYYDPLANWKAEIGRGSKVPVYQLLEFRSKLDKEIFDLENSYYEIKFPNSLKKRSLRILRWIRTHTIETVFSALLLSLLAILGFSWLK